MATQLDRSPAAIRTPAVRCRAPTPARRCWTGSADTSTSLRAPRAPVRSVRAAGVRRAAPRPVASVWSPALINMGRRNEAPCARGRAADPGRRGVARFDHRQLRRADAPALEAGRLRARRQHQDARHRARRVHGARRPSAGAAARHLRPATAPTAPGCASPGPGPYVTPDIDDVGLHEHQHQADGRAWTEADGGGAVHAGHVRRLDADVRHAGHQGQRAAADARA